MVYQSYEDFYLRAFPFLFSYVFQIQPHLHTDVKVKLEFELKSDFKLKTELIENI